MRDDAKSKKAESEDEEDIQEGYIFVVGGPNLRDGQIALAEVHPAHPYVKSNNPNKGGENQAYVVKGKPGKWVGRTREVSKQISRGLLREARPPKDSPMPDPSDQKPVTKSSVQAEELVARRQETGVGGVDETEVQRQIDEATEKVKADAQRQIDEATGKAQADAQTEINRLKAEIAQRDEEAQMAAMEAATRPDNPPVVPGSGAPPDADQKDAKPEKPEKPAKPA